MSTLQQSCSDTMRSSPPSLSDTANEAASQQYAKRAKLGTAMEAVMLDDHRKLARADREKVRLLENKRLGIDTGAEDDVGDIIVTDDYHINEGGRGVFWKVLGASLLGAGMVAGPLLTYLLMRQPQPTNATPGKDTDTAYTIDFAE